jgi:hypothetical protein
MNTLQIPEFVFVAQPNSTLSLVERIKFQPMRGLSRRRRRGALGLVGTFLSVGVGILLIVAAFSLYRSVLDTYRVTQLTLQTGQMIGSIQRAYANSPSYDAGSLVAVLDGGGDIPTAARRVSADDTVSIQTPYGGAITFVGDGGSELTITIADLPQGACEKFLEGYIGLGSNASDLSGITVGLTAMPLPLGRAAIATGCVDGENSVILVY